jgi:hypothetical protein
MVFRVHGYLAPANRRPRAGLFLPECGTSVRSAAQPGKPRVM